MEKYQEIADSPMIRRISDGALIPRDPANYDFQLFLASGEKLEPADAPIEVPDKRSEAIQALDSASRDLTVPASVREALTKLRELL